MFVPTVPADGVKPLITGPVTMKLEPLVAIELPTLMETGPVVAPDGTVTTTCVVVAAATIAFVPLNATTFAAGLAAKPVPEIVTLVPTGPLDGVKPLIVRAVGVTEKFVALVAICPATDTRIVPVVAPAGTTAISCVADADVTAAAVPLNVTELPAGVVAKFDPLIVTGVPTGPELGENPEIVGGGVTTAKLFALVPVCPATVTEIGPVVAPAGTVAVNRVVVADVTVAGVPLNVTELLEGVAL
jgi:hypothetical protein